MTVILAKLRLILLSMKYCRSVVYDQVQELASIGFDLRAISMQGGLSS